MRKAHGRRVRTALLSRLTLGNEAHVLDGGLELAHVGVGRDIHDECLVQGLDEDLHCCKDTRLLERHQRSLEQTTSDCGADEGDRTTRGAAVCQNERVVSNTQR